MENIFASLAGQFDDEVVSNVTGALSISPQVARTSITAAMPLIVSAVAGKAAQPDSAASLSRTFGTLTSMGSSQPGTMIAGLLNDDKARNAGANMAKSLFGAQFGATTSTLATQAGVSEDVAGKLLGLAVPAVLGALGTQTKQRGVDAAGLADFFIEVSQPAEVAAPMQSDSTSAMQDAASDATSIAESLKRGLKKLFGRA